MDTVYRVVMNDEEQYSILPDHIGNRLGWREIGHVGTREECPADIDQIWTDMRPLSVRANSE